LEVDAELRPFIVVRLCMDMWLDYAVEFFWRVVGRERRSL